MKLKGLFGEFFFVQGFDYDFEVVFGECQPSLSTGGILIITFDWLFASFGYI